MRSVLVDKGTYVLTCLSLLLLATSSIAQPRRWRAYEMKDGDIGAYIQAARVRHPALNERVGAIAMDFLGQPYTQTPRLFDWRQDDCVTFVERVLALALAVDRESYYRLVARLRYAGGELPFSPGTFSLQDFELVPNDPADAPRRELNKNHFTEGQWVPNNRWCLQDITKSLGGSEIKPWLPMHHIMRPKALLAKKGLQVDMPDVKVVDAFIPREAIPQILPELRTGDIVLTIVGTWENRYCDHMGLIVERTEFDAVDSDGPPSIVHAVPPKTRRESLVRFLRRFPRIQGFKFLRLAPEAQEAAQRESQAMAGRLPVPAILNPPGPRDGEVRP